MKGSLSFTAPEASLAKSIPKRGHFIEAKNFCSNFLKRCQSNDLGVPSEKSEEIVTLLRRMKEYDNFKELEIVMYKIGKILFCLGFLDHSLRFYLKGLKTVSTMKLKGNYYNNIGLIYRQQAKFTKALEFYDKALRIWDDYDDRISKCATLCNIGMTHYVGFNEREISRQNFEEALKISREEGIRDKRMEASCLNNLGYVCSPDDDVNKSSRLFNEALKIWKEIGDEKGLSVTLNNLGLREKTLGNNGKCLVYYRKSLGIRRKIGDRLGEAESLWNLAFLSENVSHCKESLSFLLGSKKIYEDLKLRRRAKELDTHIERVQMKVENEDLEQAMKQLKGKSFRDFALLRPLIQGESNESNIFHGSMSTVMQVELKNERTPFPLAMRVFTQEGVNPVSIPEHTNVLPVLLRFNDTVNERTMPKFHEFFDGDFSTTVMVTKLYDTNLRVFVESNKEKITEELILKFLRDILSGICHLHRHGLVHRDLKPENLFLSKRNARIVVGDFSKTVDVSKFPNFQVPYNEDEDGETHGGVCFFETSPPEIVGLELDITSVFNYSKSDVFSAGIILYWLMLRGEVKFLRDIIAAVGKDKYPEVFCDLYSIDVVDLLTSMCNFDVDRRITCYDALKAVEKLIK